MKSDKKEEIKKISKQFAFLPAWFPYVGIALAGIILVRRGYRLSERQLMHERIHFRQQRELLWLPFFILYILEFLVRYLRNGFKWDKAYRSISFEREAYQNEDNPKYLEERKVFAWRRYVNGGW